jgi:hypothetical protein
LRIANEGVVLLNRSGKSGSQKNSFNESADSLVRAWTTSRDVKSHLDSQSTINFVLRGRVQNASYDDYECDVEEHLGEKFQDILKSLDMRVSHYLCDIASNHS